MRQLFASISLITDLLLIFTTYNSFTITNLQLRKLIITNTITIAVTTSLTSALPIYFQGYSFH